MYGDEEKEFDDEKESMHGMHIEGDDEKEEGAPGDEEEEEMM